MRQLMLTLSGVLRSAVEDGIIAANPLAGLGKTLNLGKAHDVETDQAKALDADQLRRFLLVAKDETPEDLAAFCVMAWAGMRLGEALGMQWQDVDFPSGRIAVRRQLSGPLKTKTGRRDVDMASPLQEVLRRLLAFRRKEAFRQGRELPTWVLYPELGDQPDQRIEGRLVKRIRSRMTRVLKVAGLPQDFTPHSLRHTYASLLVSRGTSLAYVQRMLGHASISMTVDTYGSWLRPEAPGAADALAEGLSLESGNKRVDLETFRVNVPGRKALA